MRVLMTPSGKAAHLPARDAYTSPEAFPACTPVGTAISGGLTTFRTGDAVAVTCKRCLAKVEKAHAEALSMHEAESAAARSRNLDAQLAARQAEKCGQCGSARGNPRHQAEGHSFVEHEFAEPATEDGGMVVELAAGQVSGYVKPGDRLQHDTTGERGTVDAVGPNALDLTMDDGTRKSAASWRWEPISGKSEAAPEIVIDPSKYDSDAQLAEATAQVRALRKAGPIDKQAVLATRVDSLMNSGVSDAQRVAELEQEGPLSRQLRELAETPPLRLRETLAQSALDGSQFRATPQQVADLTWFISHQAKRFADGLVPEVSRQNFRVQMATTVATLACWLGMSEPVELASYPSPYGGRDRLAEVRHARAAGNGWAGVPVAQTLDEIWNAQTGIRGRLCRIGSSRWTTYGATCNAPVNDDGTCPEAHSHV